MGFHVPVFRGTSVLLAAFAVAAGGGWLTGCEPRVQGIMDYSLLLGVKRKEFHVNASVNLVQHNTLACAVLMPPCLTDRVSAGVGVAPANRPSCIRTDLSGSYMVELVLVLELVPGNATNPAAWYTPVACSHVLCLCAAWEAPPTWVSTAFTSPLCPRMSAAPTSVSVWAVAPAPAPQQLA